MKAGLALLELQLALLHHCAALLERGKDKAAWARVEGAVSALHAAVRGQAIGKAFPCPSCGKRSAIVRWAENESCCPKCGHFVELRAAGGD